MKASRLIRLIILLRANRSMECSRLARELGVSERTVYRDIDALSEIHVPIHYDGHGYQIGDNSFLPILNLDLEEYLLFKSALESPTAQATTASRELVRQLLAKVDAVLSSKVREGKRHSGVTNRLLLRSSHDPQQTEKWMPQLTRAIQTDTLVEIEYDSLGRGRSVRELEPYQIIFRGRAYYLIAYAAEHGEYRQYRLDRMVAVTLTTRHFFPRTDLDVGKLYEDRFEFESGSKWIDLEVLFRGRGAKVVSTGKRFDGEVVEPIPDGGVRYTARVPESSEILRWLLGFGNEAEVLAPVSVRQSLAEIGSYYTDTYGENDAPSVPPRLIFRRGAERTEKG